MWLAPNLLHITGISFDHSDSGRKCRQSKRNDSSKQQSHQSHPPPKDVFVGDVRIELDDPKRNSVRFGVDNVNHNFPRIRKKSQLFLRPQ